MNLLFPIFFAVVPDPLGEAKMGGFCKDHLQTEQDKVCQ